MRMNIDYYQHFHMHNLLTYFTEAYIFKGMISTAINLYMTISRYSNLIQIIEILTAFNLFVVP